MLSTTFFSLEEARRQIDYRQGVLEFVFTDRTFSVNIDNLDEVQSTLDTWKTLYKLREQVK